MLRSLASILVLLAGLYLVGLAVAAMFYPVPATRFLRRFASSARTHYVELALRLVAGGAILLHAPYMRFSGFFVLFGWVLLITTGGLLAIPWQWHHRFADRGVPFATRHLKLVAIGSLLLGGGILASLFS